MKYEGKTTGRTSYFVKQSKLCGNFKIYIDVIAVAKSFGDKSSVN